MALIYSLLRIILLIASTVLLGVALYRANIKEKAGHIADLAGHSMEKRLKNSRVEALKYDKLAEKLSRTGVDFMFDGEVTPVTYISVKIMLGVLGFFVGFSLFQGVGAIMASIVGYFLPNMLIKVSNESDNDAMLDDMKAVYDTLCIQTKAGVYLANALGECYLAVKNKRLKQALLQLNNTIIATKDIEAALDEFNLKFDNSFIDTFCITIRQSLSTGQAAQILSDISIQVGDIQNALNMKEKEKLERKIQLMEMLAFVGMMAVCLFSLAIEVVGSLSNF